MEGTSVRSPERGSVRFKALETRHSRILLKLGFCLGRVSDPVASSSPTNSETCEHVLARHSLTLLCCTVLCPYCLFVCLSVYLCVCLHHPTCLLRDSTNPDLAQLTANQSTLPYMPYRTEWTRWASPMHTSLHSNNNYNTVSFFQQRTALRHQHMLPQGNARLLMYPLKKNLVMKPHIR